MQRLRLLLVRRPGAIAWLVACVLAVRLLVPAGYMPAMGAHGVALSLCPGTMPVAHAPAMHHGGGGEPGERSAPTAAMPCAFAGAGTAVLDVPVVAVVLLAIVPASVSGMRIVAPRSARPSARWRPPLRAPPFG